MSQILQNNFLSFLLSQFVSFQVNTICINMKTSALIIAASLASASAFAPSSNGARAATELSAEKKSFFSTIFDMDLFAPKADQNDYGARNAKNVKVGELSSNSYVPAGLTREQFDKIRKADAKKKADNYARNVAKAGIFEDYTEWYTKRGTDLNQDWAKNKNTLGHRMAKTKYDWSGDNDKPLWAKKK